MRIVMKCPKLEIKCGKAFSCYNFDIWALGIQCNVPAREKEFVYFKNKYFIE